MGIIQLVTALLLACQDVESVRRCYIGVLDIYMNPNTLTMMDLLEVNTFKLMDCNKAHYDKEIIQVNERRYEFGESYGADDWVCAKIPHDGRIKKDCVPKRDAPGWYAHLLENRDFKGCNGAVCYCDDRDACNKAEIVLQNSFLFFILLFFYLTL